VQKVAFTSVDMLLFMAVLSMLIGGKKFFDLCETCSVQFWYKRHEAKKALCKKIIIFQTIVLMPKHITFDYKMYHKVLSHNTLYVKTIFNLLSSLSVVTIDGPKLCEISTSNQFLTGIRYNFFGACHPKIPWY